jgi:dihydrofolate synthase/folylpolyglutamate synthase
MPEADLLSYLFGLDQFGIKFGLDNIAALVAHLDHPERAFRSVHVAGTNGKGSVTAMIDAALRAAGYRTARYTSPHLMAVNERFVVSGRPIDDRSMYQAIADVRTAIDALRSDGTLEVQPTFFDVTTAVAFETFRRAAVDVAVVEVGLGGRLDATNVVTPEVSAITSIAFDHQLYLGSTLATIAAEKAGIIKPGIPVVIGEMPREARDVIERIATERTAPIVHAIAADVGSRTVGLRGAHQRQNAAVALRVLEMLDARGTRVSRDAIDSGLADASWPGRLDLRKLDDGRELLMDAAHNAAGADALAAFLRSDVGPLPLVFAAMRDKDVDSMLRALLPAVATVTVTRASNARSADPDELGRVVHRLAPSMPVAIEPSLPAALDAAWRTSPRIVVAGSIFLLGDVMHALGLHW